MDSMVRFGGGSPIAHVCLDLPPKWTARVLTGDMSFDDAERDALEHCEFLEWLDFACELSLRDMSGKALASDLTKSWCCYSGHDPKNHDQSQRFADRLYDLGITYELPTINGKIAPHFNGISLKPHAQIAA